jgi:hypothetical protein
MAAAPSGDGPLGLRFRAATRPRVVQLRGGRRGEVGEDGADPDQVERIGRERGAGFLAAQDIDAPAHAVLAEIGDFGDGIGKRGLQVARDTAVAAAEIEDVFDRLVAAGVTLARGEGCHDGEECGFSDVEIVLVLAAFRHHVLGRHVTVDDNLADAVDEKVGDVHVGITLAGTGLARRGHMGAPAHGRRLASPGAYFGGWGMRRQFGGMSLMAQFGRLVLP